MGRIIIPKYEVIKDAVIVFESDIGAGKTTIEERLKKLGYQVFLELHQIIETLPLFYIDQERWAFTTQVGFLVARGFQLLGIKALPGIKFVERTIYSDFYQFATMLHDAGKMRKEEWNTYCNLFKILTDGILNNPLPDIAIMIKNPIEIYQKQIKKRGRKMEEWLWKTEAGRKYLEELEAKIESSLPFVAKDYFKISGDNVDRKVIEVFDGLENRGFIKRI